MNKKIIIIIGIVLVLIIGAVVGIVVVNKLNSAQVNNGGENDITNQISNDSSKLGTYLSGLTNNYYIKYSGDFKSNSGESINAIVEYTKDGKDFALKSTALDMHLICTEDKLYSISHTYKMIVEMNKESFDISEYNPASNIGQTFIKSYKESLNNTEYDVEEYTYKGNTVKYYFKGTDLRIIRYNSSEILIIRVEKNTNTNLLVKPNGYSNI